MVKKTKLYKWIGILAILVAGVIHLYDAPGEFKDAPYMGILFFIFFLGSIIAAVGIQRKQYFWGWAFGAFLSLGAIAGYLVSRTVGMPISGREDWGPPLAYFALFIELVFFSFSYIVRPATLRRAH